LSIPDRDSLTLKPDGELRYISRETGMVNGELRDDKVRPPAIDGDDIVSGSAVFGGDIILDDQLLRWLRVRRSMAPT